MCVLVKSSLSKNFSQKKNLWFLFFAKKTNQKETTRKEKKRKKEIKKQSNFGVVSNFAGKQPKKAKPKKVPIKIDPKLGEVGTSRKGGRSLKAKFWWCVCTLSEENHPLHSSRSAFSFFFVEFI